MAIILIAIAVFGTSPIQVQASQHGPGLTAVNDGEEPEYSVQYSIPVVTDASQFYCNNLSTEGSLANLIDSDPNTHFISAYNESRHTNDPDNYHYLQVYADGGLPDKFVMHWRTRGSVWANMYRPTHIVLSVSVDGDTWAELDEWKNPEAEFPVTADVPEYTSPVITLDDNYNYFRITVLETNDNGMSSDGHPFFNFAEYNLYPVIVKGKETLADVLNSMSLSPDDYQYGTDPGYIGDHTVWQNFQDLYLKAMRYVSESGHTDEELNELKDQFVAAEQVAREAVVPVKDGGYYYITTANTQFIDAAKTNYGWYAPANSANDIGWKALEESSQFVWKFLKNDDGSYKIQNLLTEMYVDSTYKNQLSQTAFLSELPVRNQLVKPLTYAGVLSIEWDGAIAVYHQGGHAEGKGESGTILQWNGQAGSPSSWYLREVPDELVQRLTDNRELERLKSYLGMNPDLMENYSVGERVGQLNSQEAYNNIKSAYETALEEVNNQHSGEEFAAYLSNLKEAIANAEANATNGIKEGYYKFMVANPFCLDNENENLHTLAWAHHSTNPNVIEWSKDDGTADYIWKLTQADGEDNYYIQNISTKRYVYCGATLARGNNIGSTADGKTKHYFDILNHNGVVNVYNTDYTSYPYHALNWNLAENGTICYAEGDPSKWYMVPVNEAEAEKLALEALTKNRIDTLKSIIGTAKAKINETDIAVYDMSSPVVTDADNLYSNAQAYEASEQTSYANLIDGDYGTIFHSRYNSLEPIDDYHYLRVYAPNGLPEKFGIHWAKRCFNETEANNEACRPTKIAIGLSNDAEKWEMTDTLTTADGLPTITTDTFYTSKKPIEGKSYKYFIMKVLEVNHNFNMSDYFGHPFFTMSEYNLYPYIGSDPASQINDPEIKAVVEELQEAIETAQAVIASGTVTDNDIPALQTAYDKLVTAWKDTTELSRLLAETRMFADMPEGDGSIVGDMPQDAIGKIAETLSNSGLKEKNLYTLSKSEIEAYTTTLKTAQKEFFDRMTKPEAGMWYVIETAEENEQRIGKVMNSGGYYGHGPGDKHTHYSYWLDGMTLNDVETNDRTAFVFRANEDGTFTIQNVGSGFYNGPETGSGNATYNYRPIQWYEPNPVDIIPFGYGQVGFRMESGRYIRGNAAWYADGMTYEYNEGAAFANSALAWKLRPIYEVCSGMKVRQNIAQGRAIAITKPYDLDGMPETEYGFLQGYKIVGKVYSDDDPDMITAYKLQAYSQYELIPAGTPVVYIAEGDTYNESVTYQADFQPLIDGEVTHKPDTVNGLMGTTDYYYTPEGHLGYFLADSVVDEPVNTEIGFHRALIIPRLVKELSDEDPGVTVDRIIYVKGAGMLNGMSTVRIENPAEHVNVYTTDGVLVRRNVSRESATAGLAKGIYIVCKQKVLVK